MSLSLKNPINIKNIILGTLIVLLTMVASQIAFLGYTVVFFQVLFFFYLLVFNEKMALPYFIFSLATSLEFSTFVNGGDSQLYNLSNIKLAGLNIGIYMLLMLMFNIFFYDNKIIKKKYTSWQQWFFIILISLMYLQSVIISIFDYYIGWSPLNNFDINHIFGLTYLQLWPFILLILYFSYVRKYENGLDYLKYTIGFTLISTLSASLIVNLFGVQGKYGDNDYYLAPTLIFLGSFIIIIFKDKIFSIKPISLFIAYSFLIIIPIFFLNLTGGKIIIFSIIAIILYSKKINLTKILSVILIFFMVLYLSIDFIDEGSLIKNKIDEIYSLFNILSGNWYLLLQPSTRFRVDEFINIYLHYALNPIHIISGFGILAGAPDYIGGYGILADGSFPDIEYSRSYFMSYHEITSFIIKYGIIGLIVYVWLILFSYKNRGKSYFLPIGIIWFIMFWGYSQTLAVMGAAILVVGIMDIKKNNKLLMGSVN